MCKRLAEEEHYSIPASRDCPFPTCVQLLPTQLPHCAGNLPARRSAAAAGPSGGTLTARPAEQDPGSKLLHHQPLRSGRLPRPQKLCPGGLSAHVGSQGGFSDTAGTESMHSSGISSTWRAAIRSFATHGRNKTSAGGVSTCPGLGMGSRVQKRHSGELQHSTGRQNRHWLLPDCLSAAW